jgi:glycosyltransferase involved in cell wall biosynthesis
MRLLFVKEKMTWPRLSGHDVHCFYMMQALARLGHEVSLVTAAEPAPEAIAGLPLALQDCFGTDGAPPPVVSWPATHLQERFRSYWGIGAARIAAIARAAQDCRADVVVVVGLNVLPYLLGVRNAGRVWYAADEWTWHHLSQTRLTQPATWREIRTALVKGLYERAYGSILDRVWVVTEADRRAMHWVAGVDNIDVLPNGVDGEHYLPLEERPGQPSCAFWGRLDFGPNIQALEWFCRRVWPAARRAVPEARFTIYGFQPTPAVQALASRDGIDLIPNLPDLRDEIARHQVVVMPFVSGGGIKNKLLEAAAMGKAIVCSPRACGGLRGGDALPFRQASGIANWVRELTALWMDADSRKACGAAARQWVLKHHTWQAAARTALAGLEATRTQRRES